MVQPLDYEKRYALPRVVVRAAFVFALAGLCALGWTGWRISHGVTKPGSGSVNQMHIYDRRVRDVLGDPDTSEPKRTAALLATVNGYRQQGVLPIPGVPSEGETQLAILLWRDANRAFVGEEKAREFLAYMDRAYPPAVRIDKVQTDFERWSTTRAHREQVRERENGSQEAP